MKSNITIIYPKDETTDFLKPISDFLITKFGNKQVSFFRIGFSVKEHYNCVNFLRNTCPDDSLIVFLGHGTSNSLLGSISDTFPRQTLLRKNQTNILLNKQVFALACRSREFLSGDGIHGIGFGNIPTSMDEINRERMKNALNYFGVESADINQFNDFLVEIVKYSLYELVKENLNLYDFFLRLKLRFNKKIAKLVTENKSEDVEALINLIYEAKTEMKYFYN